MLAVTTSVPVYTQPPSATESPTSALNRCRARKRSTGASLLIAMSSFRISRAFLSIDDEAEIGRIDSNLFDAAGNAVDPVDLAQQRRLDVRGGRKPVIGT